MAPSVLFLLWFRSQEPTADVAEGWMDWTSSLSNLMHSPFNGQVWLDLASRHPILLVQVLFFLNVNVLFYILGTLQGSFWLIDPYWTLLPVMILHTWAAHPAAVWTGRSLLAAGLLWLWSLRLTHSYFRREGWKFGVREDWRFTDMRTRYGVHWHWVSFFAVFLSQQLMLVGLSLPASVVFFDKAATPLHLLDGLAVVGALSGLLCAYVADTQLRAFMVEKGKPAGKLLDSGLWYYSRHPNYFGEQLFWWSWASLAAVSLGAGWALAGTAFNSYVLYEVTRMTETRMMAVQARRVAYARYARRTSVWLPLPKFGPEEFDD